MKAKEELKAKSKRKVWIFALACILVATVFSTKWEVEVGHTAIQWSGAYYCRRITLGHTNGE